MLMKIAHHDDGKEKCQSHKCYLFNDVDGYYNFDLTNIYAYGETKEEAVKNFKEELTYEVYETKIINPDDISELEIQEGQDIITLITCHPYRINTQRYIIKAKRV